METINKQLTYTIILPAHNEEDTVGIVLDAALGTDTTEILVIDDGSTDSTANIVKERVMQDARVRLISHDINLGVGCARKRGIQEATTPLVLFFDTDVSTATTEQFQQIIDPLVSDTVDFVVGGFESFGRVTELFAKPLLRYFVPALSTITQPLSGLFGARKEFLFTESIADGHAICGILLDAYFAGARITEVNIGKIIHDKRPNEQKIEQAQSECEILFKKLIEHDILSIRDVRSIKDERMPAFCYGF